MLYNLAKKLSVIVMIFIFHPGITTAERWFLVAKKFSVENSERFSKLLLAINFLLDGNFFPPKALQRGAYLIIMLNVSEYLMEKLTARNGNKERQKMLQESFDWIEQFQEDSCFWNVRKGTFSLLTYFLNSLKITIIWSRRKSI